MAEAEVQVYPKRPNDWQEAWAWSVTQQLKELESKINLVMAELRKLVTAATGSGAGRITPELAAAVAQVGTAARKVDRQVPDRKRQPVKKKQVKRKR